MAGDRILITGGTGFAGSHLVEALLASGESDIHVTSQSGHGGYVGKLLAATQIHQLDLTNFTATNELLKSLQPQVIYHLASSAVVGGSFTQMQKVLDDHTHLQLSLLESVKQSVPKARVLAIGSGLEYATKPDQTHLVIHEDAPIGPASLYGISKVIQSLLAEYFAKIFKLDIVIARPFNHIGERQAPGFVVSDFAQQVVKVERGEQSEIMVGNLSAERDFTDVKDMVKAYIILANKGQSGQVYNLGSGEGYSIQQILDWLKEAAKIQIKVSLDPQKFRPRDITSIIADNKKVCALGWQPTLDIKPTVLRTLDWWRNQN